MEENQNPRLELYNLLVENKLDGGLSFEQFEAGFSSNPDAQAALYKEMDSAGILGGLSQDEFASGFFPQKKNLQPSSPSSEPSSDGSPTSEPLPEGTAGPAQVPFPEPAEPIQPAEQTIEQPAGFGDRLLSYLGSFEKGAVQDVVASPLRAAGEIQGMLTRSLGAEDFQDEDSWLYQAGQAIQGASEELLYEDPEIKEEFTSQVSRGLGQAVGMIMSSPSMAAKAPQGLIASKEILKEGAKQFFSRPAAIGALQMVDQEFEELAVEKQAAESMSRDEYMAANGGTEAAGQKYDILTSASEDELRAQILPGALAAGSTEMVPIASMFNRLDKATGGTFSKRALQYAKDKGVALLEGATQEALQEAMTNLSAAQVYDLTKDLTDGLEESAKVGGATQLVLEMLMGAVTGRRVNAGAADMDRIRAAEDVIRAKEEALAENLINEASETELGQAETETEGQEPAGTAPEGEAQPEEVSRTVDDIFDEDEDITVLKESFLATPRSDDADADFDNWIQELPEAEREAAVIRQEEIILTRKLQDLQDAENQGTNAEPVVDEGTEQQPTEQGNELPNNEFTQAGAVVVYRGERPGGNPTNYGFTWFSESEQLAKEYSFDGSKFGEVSSQEIQKPRNPFSVRFKTNVDVRAKDITNVLFSDVADKVESGEITEQEAERILDMIDEYETAAGDSLEKFHTKINKPEASDIFADVLRALGYDAIEQYEQVDGNRVLTYGLINEKASQATNETKVPGEQSRPAQVQAQPEITGEVFQLDVDDNARQEAFTRLEQAGIIPENAKRKIEAASKAGIDVIFTDADGGMTSVIPESSMSMMTKSPKSNIVARVGLNSDNASHILDHEIAHGAFFKAFGTDKQSAPRKRIKSVIESSLVASAEDNAKIKQFLERYPKSERTDEFLAESLALLSSGKVKLKQSALEKVVTAVKEIASKILGTPINYDINNDADVRRMFKAMAGAISGKSGRDLNAVIQSAAAKAYPNIDQVKKYTAKYLPKSVSDNPNFNTAVKFIQQNDVVHSDQDIAKVVVKQLGFSPFEVTELFEAALGRKYRGLHPIQQTQNAKYEYFQLFGLFTKFKQAAYRADMYVRNAGTFLRNQVVDIERRLGITLPSHLNPYEAFQLWKPKAAYTEKTVNDAFFGGESKQSKRESFIGRLNAAGISTVEFNEFMVAQHAPERYERVAEMNEDNLRDAMRRVELKVYKDGNEDAKGFLPNQKRFPLSPDLIKRAQDMAAGTPHLAKLMQSKMDAVDAAYNKLNEMRQYQQDVYQKMGLDKANSARQFFTEFQRDYLHKFVDVLEQAGMVDAKRAAYLRNGVSDNSDVVFQSYVPMLIKDEVYADEAGEFHDPLGRDFDSMAANVYNNGIHGLTGNTDFNVEDLQRPLDVSYHRLINAIKAAEYNTAMRTLADFVQKYGNPDRVRVVKSRSVPKVNEFGDIEGVDDYTPDIVKEKGHAYRMANGKLAYVYFTDPNDGIRNALTSNRYQPDAIAQWFVDKARAMNNFYRALLITYNPSFMVGNPFRDAQEAFANIRSEYNVRGMRRELAKRMGQSLAFFANDNAPVISRLTKDAADQDGAMKEMADYWDEAQRMGVRMSWAMVNEPATTESIQKQIDEVESLMRGGKVKAAKRVAKRIDKFFSNAADYSENIVRLGAYSALRSKGVPAQKAAYIARNITIDFEKRGSSKFLNSFVTPLYLFLNVGIQGAGRGLKLFTTRGGRASLAMMTGVYALNRILLHELAAAVGGEDEEEFASNYINNDFIRRNYSLIFNPFDPKNPIRIPKPYSPVRMVSSIAENLIDKAYGKRTIGDAVMDMFEDATTVIDPVSGGSGSWPSYAPFALLHPLIEAGIANQDWMGNEILRARDKGVDAYTFNTSTEAAKFDLGGMEVPIGKAYVKTAQGAYKWTRGMIDISPTTLEYITDAYILKTPPMKAMGNVEDAITEYSQDGDPLKLMAGVVSGAGGRKLYDPLDEKEKQVLFNFFDIADRERVRGMTDEHFDQLKKSLRIIRRKELADKRTINSWLETMKLKFPEYERKIERLK